MVCLVIQGYMCSWVYSGVIRELESQHWRLRALGNCIAWLEGQFDVPENGFMRTKIHTR